MEDRRKAVRAPYIVWHEHYSVFDDTLDQQHQRLVALINKLYAGLRDGILPLMASLLQELEEYTREHFAAEEAILLQCGYDRLDEHRKLHEWMALKTAAMRISLKTGNKEAAKETLSFLKSWWTNHILTVDQEYTACLRRDLRLAAS